jgi:hypothetical protein
MIFSKTRRPHRDQHQIQETCGGGGGHGDWLGQIAVILSFIKLAGLYDGAQSVLVVNFHAKVSLRNFGYKK